MVGSDWLPISNGFDVRLGGEMGTIFPYTKEIVTLRHTQNFRYLQNLISLQLDGIVL